MPMNGNTLGEEIFAAVKSVAENQETSAEDVAEARWQAIANAIVDHIAANATVAPLTVTMTPNDGPGHVHTPSVTVTATGKIS